MLVAKTPLSGSKFLVFYILIVFLGKLCQFGGTSTHIYADSDYISF
jgi:hypothetical protein